MYSEKKINTVKYITFRGILFEILKIEVIIYFDNKVPDCVVSKYALIRCNHKERSIALICVRPVLLTLDSASLRTVGEHDYCRGSLLPHHPPEVNQGIGKWTYMFINE